MRRGDSFVINLDYKRRAFRQMTYYKNPRTHLWMDAISIAFLPQIWVKSQQEPAWKRVLVDQNARTQGKHRISNIKLKWEGGNLHENIVKLVVAVENSMWARGKAHINKPTIVWTFSFSARAHGWHLRVSAMWGVCAACPCKSLSLDPNYSFRLTSSASFPRVPPSNEPSPRRSFELGAAGGRGKARLAHCSSEQLYFRGSEKLKKRAFITIFIYALRLWKSGPETYKCWF